MRTNIHRVAAIIAGALFTILMLAGCAATQQPEPATPAAAPIQATSVLPAAAPGGAPPDVAAAQETLQRFLNALTDGDYALAATLYAGDYELLRGYNPSIPADDHAALLRAACNANGFVCLRPSAMSVAGDSANGLTFAVQFINPDGSDFVVTPPPGAPGEPRRSFPFRVVTGLEGPRVLDLPPYVS